MTGATLMSSSILRQVLIEFKEGLQIFRLCFTASPRRHLVERARFRRAPLSVSQGITVSTSVGPRRSAGTAGAWALGLAPLMEDSGGVPDRLCHAEVAECQPLGCGAAEHLKPVA